MKRIVFDEAEAVAALRQTIECKDSFIGLHEPIFCGQEWLYVKECIDTGWVSSVGKFVDRFEKQLVEYTGVSHAVAVVNGTAALHICLELAGVREDDEVLIPALTFIATANAVSYCKAVPHFVDCEEKTLGLDPYRLGEYLDEIVEMKNGESWNRMTGRRIAAVVPMHAFGHPVDLDPLMEICERFGIVLIEDAAESLGSFYKGQHTGHHGRLSALSFNGNKIVTTGGGGAILTNDIKLAQFAKHLTTTAKVPHRWEFMHDHVGYNYRLPNINAALGCAQLDKLPWFLDKKRALAHRYQRAFSSVKGIKFFTEAEFAKSNYWLNVLLLDDSFSDNLEKFLKVTNDQGIMTRPAWTLMSELSMYKNCPKMELSVSKNLSRRLINIPSSVKL